MDKKGKREQKVCGWSKSEKGVSQKADGGVMAGPREWVCANISRTSPGERFEMDSSNLSSLITKFKKSLQGRDCNYRQHAECINALTTQVSWRFALTDEKRLVKVKVFLAIFMRETLTRLNSEHDRALQKYSAERFSHTPESWVFIVDFQDKE